ncbi:MAG: class I SAM-dependent methyltransferase [Silicimonas sp.]|nr:class I SAM-dependent methyltransferase [Silicimonas sp.]
MLSDRLTLALDTGTIALPGEGRIAVAGATARDDLSMLPRERITVISHFYPDYQAFKTAGYNVNIAFEGPFVATIIALPRAKKAAQEMVAKAARATDGPLIIDGQKTSGVASMLKALKARALVGEVLSKAHGKIFAVTGGDFSDWLHDETHIDGFVTAPGVFSADGIDPGSAALASALPKVLKGRVIDLGAGWGYLSHAVLQREGVTHVDLVEADAVALDLARKNITDSRATFLWDDATTYVGEAADHIVTNPPFHTDRTANPDLGRAFIRHAAKLLKPKGTLWLVANRHLPYESTLEERFQTVQLLNQSASYKIYTATRPKSPR